MESNSYEKMVQEKKQRASVIAKAEDNLFFDNAIDFNHPYKQKTIVQNDYEQRSFLGFNYKKLVGTKVIPIALCEICNKLEIEHA